MYDVVVVGGGIGGLTAAALLSARGVKTCLLERQSQAGGCIGKIEFSGYDFEPGMGLYTSWGGGDIYDQIFAELPTRQPQAMLIDSDYVIRFDSDIALKKETAAFDEQLRTAFPDCAQAAVDFYQLVSRSSQASSLRASSVRSSGFLSKAFKRLRPKSQLPDDFVAAETRTALSLASDTSPRFQRFIDAQLQAFLHTSIDRCPFLQACGALSLPRCDLYSIAGGISALAETLAEAIRLTGGLVRFNTPVLRLAYDDKGTAVGVDLLSGERVFAKHAIISNLTVWDTYGKLVGLNRTPSTIKTELAKLETRGAYVIYAAVEESAAARLPARNFLVALDKDSAEQNISDEITFSIGQRSLEGKWPATIKAATEVAPWFSFQTSEEDYEARDQQTLEALWARLHSAVPELGAGIEVIETANPRIYYDQTRRKLGMVMGLEKPPHFAGLNPHETCIPNLFMVGDTVTSEFGISAVAQSAFKLANQLTN
ncbi:MAG TPA: FAD-dependent oxidoreductase [Pyrinomonadaceae bacterium]|jgi:Phytoene dehydrogenase and related proteins|nr:FAD-dependent oxidoreductase [Pyrinomonadaceae bacterium]